MEKFKFDSKENLPYYNQIKRRSARQIIDYVRAVAGKAISISPKDKKGVIKAAIKILKEEKNLFIVDPSIVDKIMLSRISKGSKVLLKTSREAHTTEFDSLLNKVQGRIVEVISEPATIHPQSRFAVKHNTEAFQILATDIFYLIEERDQAELHFSNAELKAVESEEIQKVADISDMTKREMIREAKDMFNLNIGNFLSFKSIVKMRLKSIYQSKGYMVKV